MKTLPQSPELTAAARRIIWFKPPAEALNNPIELMTYAMRYATAEDMDLLLQHVGIEGLTEAIDARLPGIVDNRSWCYWNLKIGRKPQPLPTRIIPPARRTRKYRLQKSNVDANVFSIIRDMGELCAELTNNFRELDTSIARFTPVSRRRLRRLRERAKHIQSRLELAAYELRNYPQKDE
jgi:hypothetical protein